MDKQSIITALLALESKGLAIILPESSSGSRSKAMSQKLSKHHFSL